jgi:predicted enzyme related to lactoylglutathione lyase
MTAQTTTGTPEQRALAGSVSWFEVGTPNLEAAKAFYGGMFGWSFTADESSGGAYQIVTTGDGHPIHGGLFDSTDRAPSYAVFCVLVADVAETCARAETLGGSVITGPVTTEAGLVFAHLRDTDGNHFSVYSPRPGNAG